MTNSETTSSLGRSADKFSNQSKNSGNHLVETALNAGEEFGSAAKVEFNKIMTDLQDLVSRASKLSGQELTALRQQMSDKLILAKEKLHNLSEDASVAAHKGFDSTEQMIKDRPLQAIGIAALAGLIVGSLISRR